MHFPFSYEINVGGVIVGTIDGTALIGFDDAERDWVVAGLLFERDRPAHWVHGGNHVLMPKTHWLYARIVSALINQSRHEIDTAWLAWTAAMLPDAMQPAEVA